jgi:hypothetical protein
MKTKKSWLAVRLERITKSSHSMQQWGAWAVTIALLLAASPARSDPCPVDGGSVGPFPVGHTSFVCTNSSGRPVAVNVWYPADSHRITRRSPEAVYVMDPYTFEVGSVTSSGWEALGYDRAYEAPVPAKGPVPLVMFSTGYWVPGFTYLYFGTRLASHGYMVAVVEHFNEYTWYSSGWDPFATTMYNRPRDLSFALTQMFAKDHAPGDLLYHTIDRRYIVAAGHSIGGYAAMVELCGDDQVCDSVRVNDFGQPLPPEACQATPPDSRFTALITLDSMSDALHWEEISRIHVPSLIMGDASNADGDNPYIVDANDRAWDARPHVAVCSRTRSLRVDIDNIEHESFGSPCDGFAVLLNANLMSQEDYDLYYTSTFLCEERIPASEARRIITKYAVAWLHAEVVKDGSELSQRILTQAYTMAHEPAVEVWWNEKCRCGVTNQPGTFAYFIDMVPGTCAVADKNPTNWFIPYP